MNNNDKYILSIELDRRSKWALIRYNNKIREIVKYGDFYSKSMSEVPLMVLSKLFKDINDIYLFRNMILKNLNTIIVTPPEFAVLYWDEAKLLNEINESLGAIFKPLNHNVNKLIITRLGNYIPLTEAISLIKDGKIHPLEVIDAYWYPESVISKYFTSNNVDSLNKYIYVSAGSSSISLIPVRDNRPIVTSNENRLQTCKLITLGLYTPLFALLNNAIELIYNVNNLPNVYTEVNFNDLRILYNYIKERKELNCKENEKILDACRRVGRFIGMHEKDLIKEIIVNMYKEALTRIKKYINNCITNIINKYFDSIPRVIISGDQRWFIYNLLASEVRRHAMIINYGSEFTAIALGLYYLYKVEPNG